MKGFSLLAFIFLFVFLSVPGMARADISSGVDAGTEMGGGATKPYRRDENYVDVQPGDVDVWDNGNGISISGGGETYSVNYSLSEYAVLVSKYLDEDGKYTVQADVYFYGGAIHACYVVTDKVYISEDGSPYSPIFIRSGYSFGENGHHYRILLRDGLFKTSSSDWTESPTYYDHTFISSGDGGYSGSVYCTPYFSG